MKKLLVMSVALAALSIAFAAEDTQMSEEEMMKKWMEVASPGPEHQRMAKSVGDWDASMKFWMAPGAPVQEAKSTATEVMVNGGRVLNETVTGVVMGMPFEGHGMHGYDNFRKIYWSTWTDNMATSMMYMEGTSTDGGKTVTFNTTMDEPVMGVKDKPVRYIHKWIDDDTQVLESWDEVGTPNEFKAMEITYTRKK